MHKLAFISVILLLLGLTLGSAQADKDPSWIQFESKGAYICSCKPEENNPEKSFYQGSWKSCSERFLIQYDLSGLPKGVQITSAKLSLYCLQFVGNDSENKDLVYSRITEPWDPEKVTFANQPKIAAGEDVYGGWPLEQKWMDIDVTTMVRHWVDGSAPNYGILAHSVNDKGTCYAVFNHSNSPATKLRPKLTITYKIR
jgi:hypothetical protein